MWSLEHFKYYLYGSQFTLQTDHQALLTALKESRGNKTYQSRLTRWVDRLLPFHFTVEHVPGKNKGFADYLSRNPSGEAIQPSEEDNNFVINTIEEIKFTLLRNALTSNGAIISSNQITDTKQDRNDVIIPKQSNNTTLNAFCFNLFKNKLHTSKLYIHNSNPFNSLETNNKNLVAITTRQNHNRET